MDEQKPPADPAPEPDPKPEEYDTPFGKYSPKRTPDTVLDYRPGIGEALSGLPPAELKSLPALIERLSEQKRRSAEKPGQWVKGNVLLGAEEEEYSPSDEELVEGEIGDRIGSVVATAEAGALDETLAGAGHREEELLYRKYSFRHVDALGSGRFFYASAPLETRLRLRKR